jgi:hypothetical protein
VLLQSQKKFSTQKNKTVFFPFTVCEGGGWAEGGGVWGGRVGQRGGKLKCFAKNFARKKTHVKLVIID